MYVITDKETNRVLIVGELKEYWPNGYSVITDATGADYAFPPEFTLMTYADEVPEGVLPDAYSFTEEDGFYETPGYEPGSRYGLSEDTLQIIKDEAIAEIEEAVINGTDE